MLKPSVDSGGFLCEKDYFHLKSSAKNVCIEADYTGIKMGYENDYRFNFNINLRYANFNADDELTIRNRVVQNSSKKYSGFHESENSGNNVNINSDYGGVTLIKY